LITSYVDLLQADAALDEFGLRMLRSGASTEETATAMLELTEHFYQTLSEIAFRGYEIEAANEERLLIRPSSDRS
jgi:hypothetical protein